MVVAGLLRLEQTRLCENDAAQVDKDQGGGGDVQEVAKRGLWGRERARREVVESKSRFTCIAFGAGGRVGGHP